MPANRVMTMRQVSCLLLAALLAGCPVARPSQVDSEDEGIVGQVFFPSYRTQADIGEVATAATVSLIDPGQNQTRGTSLTDAVGRFSLSFKGLSLGDQVYYLEAVKGLNSNAVGKDAVRVRTFIQKKGSVWTSLTSRLPGSVVAINTSTTALSLIASLRQSTNPATPSVLIGTLILGAPSGGLPDSFESTGTGISPSEFNQIWNLASTALSSDTDPFDAIQYSGGNYALKPGVAGPTRPVINYLLPATAAVGTKVVLHGSGFSPILGGNVVTFNPAVGAVVTAASETAIEVTVPSGATTGDLRVDVGSLSATASFTLLPPVNGGLNP